MTTLARLSGDVDALVAVLERDLSTSSSFLAIAETYQQACMPELALEWAERGLRDFPGKQERRLREFLAAQYDRLGRHDEAMAMVWAVFEEHSSLDEYQALKSLAAPIGNWPTWRERALGLMRDQIAKRKRAAKNDTWRLLWPVDHSELVRVLLWESDTQAALSEARQGGCSTRLWLDLAVRLEADRPADAVNIYQMQIDPILSGKNKDAYREAVGLLHKIQDLMVRLDRGSDFAAYVQSVRTTHKRKRNFIKLLDSADW